MGVCGTAWIVLFGALRSTDDPRKGYRHLQAALRILAGRPETRDWHLAIFGGPTQPPVGEDGTMGFPVSWIGRLHDEVSLTLLYSAADVLVAPFLEDNLPNVVVEAASCGLPVVAFDVGGLPDIVEHQGTGWLAPLRDDNALATGISWVLADEGRRRGLANAARAKIETTFALEHCARKWVELLVAPGAPAGANGET
jgi:glycosyltransferase involved in cell wall biosynthesis